MKIVGGPEELATFIRALNDEPIYVVEDRPQERPLPLVRKTTKSAGLTNVSILLVCAGLALIMIFTYGAFQWAI